MFRRALYTILILGLPLLSLSQNNRLSDSLSTHYIDSLKQLLFSSKADSDRMVIIERIGFYYERVNTDSSVDYLNEALDIARRKHYIWAESRTLATISGVMEHRGKYAEAFELLFQSLKIAQASNSPYDIARANRRISGIYAELQNYSKAIAYLLQALSVDEANNYNDKVAIDHYALAEAYEKTNKLDSASYHVNFAIAHKDLLENLMQYVFAIDGHIKQKQEDYEQAMLSYTNAFKQAQQSSDLISFSSVCADVSTLYSKRNLKDSAILYALKGFNYAKQVSYKKGLLLNGSLLATLYDSTQPTLALQYYKSANAAKDSLYGINSLQSIEDLIVREDAKQKELEDAKAAFLTRLKLYGLLTGLVVLFIIAFVLFKNNLQRKKANVVLQEQKQKVENTLSELKSTQAQLIQSEKMASLGELTAGIAHEIQNPLNFVNNFSDVNNELVDELKSELAIGNLQSVNEIADNIKENGQKINLHGKRADSIVKGMLQHSRSGTGHKELTNINELADEYLRLSYHGIRAKDKSFNATIKTEFDNSIGKINIVPQDIGRVLLNLYNNAFYSVNQKTKQSIEGYEPTVTIITKKIGNEIEIKIADNGTGISQNIVAKIFQPFFTTKPTGEGTGLGLSLAYDIVKAHGGEIKVETKEGEGTKFIIQIPAS